MKNDDPMTDMSTKLDYNYGMTERGEVQWVDIKCPFGGDFLSPMASLVYTDAQFGDVYETAIFDFTEASAAGSYKAALKKLPNQVRLRACVDVCLCFVRVFPPYNLYTHACAIHNTYMHWR